MSIGARPARPRLTVTDLLGSTEAVHRAAACASAASPCAKRTAGCASASSSSRWIPAVTLASVGAILIAGDGRVVGRWFAKDATERPLLGAMAVPPGTYRLRVAAIDSAGRPGAAEDDVEAGLTPVGPLSLGSLMLGVSRAGRHEAAARVRIGADGDRRRSTSTAATRGPAPVGDARSGARPRRPGPRHPAARADARRRLTRRRDRDACRSARCRPATTSSAASSGSRTARPAASCGR